MNTVAAIHAGPQPELSGTVTLSDRHGAEHRDMVMHSRLATGPPADPDAGCDLHQL